MDTYQTQTFVNFYAREGYYKHIQAVCDQILQLRGDDPVFRFWKAFGIAQEKSTADAIREFNLLKNRREVKLAVYAALLHTHKQSTLVDKEEIEELNARITIEEKTSYEGAILQAACFYWHIGEEAKAREYVNQALDHQDEYLHGHVLRGWIDLTSTRGTLVSKSINYFDAVLGDTSDGAPPDISRPTIASTKKPIDAMLGKARYLEITRQFRPAIDMLNQVIVSYPAFTPALTEKAKILIKMDDWEQAAETVQRVLTQDAWNIEALLITVLYLMVRECRYSVVLENINDVVKALDKLEPKNPRLYYKIARTISRLSCGNRDVLSLSFKLIEKASHFDQKNTDYQDELAYQYTLMGDYNSAMATYKKAIEINEVNLPAYNGMVKCHILLGELDEAEAQFEFLNEIQQSIGGTSELTFLSALLAWRQQGDLHNTIKLLDETFKTHLKEVSNSDVSFEFYAQLNPNFLLEIAKEYLRHCPTEPRDPRDPPSAILEKAMDVLETIIKYVPGSIDGLLLYAQTKYISLEFDVAQLSINSCLRLEPTHSEAHLLSAKIAFAQDNFMGAHQALEQAFSHNFQVRDWPQYNLLRARVYTALGELENSLKTLEHAMSQVESVRRTKSSDPRTQASPSDICSMYLEMAEAHLRLNHIVEATKAIQDALNKFKGTAEEGRVVIANARVVANSGRGSDAIESALAILRSIPSNSPYFLKAKSEMAQIYLHLKNDKKAFSKCYEELVENYPSVSSYIFLGEAYLSIQEPEKAIASYEKALELDPNDAEIASKIGKALVATHDFAKAIEYYREAVANDPRKIILRHDLAELFLKLGNYADAERYLKEALDQAHEKQNSQEVMSLMHQVKTFLLLSKVHEGSGNIQGAIDDLLQARLLQNSVLLKIRGEQPDLVFAQRRIAAGICFELGEFYNKDRKIDKAVSFYNEALKQDDTHQKSMLALSHLYLNKGDLDGCENQCVALLRVDPANEEAAMMLADLMFRKNKFDEATEYFQQLLEKTPDNTIALVQLVQLFRRAGRLYEAPRFFKMAEKSSPRAQLLPGLHYAKGLYHRYSNNPREALREFNFARKDGEWGESAIINMIEIYLNPDNQTMWDSESDTINMNDEDGVGGGNGSSGHGNGNDVQQMQNFNAMKQGDILENVAAAEKLLKELSISRKPAVQHKKKILEAYALIARKTRPEIEKALQAFMQLLNQEKDSVQALVGMATALMMMKQTPKARNQLKRVSKMEYNQMDAEDFERGWLLLADIYIGAGKYDLAQELLKKAFNANKSCGKACELMGLIYEKEQAYKDAAESYEKAWKLSNESDPAVGFKLAFNYLKAKRYVNAIDICHKVLAMHPRYPKIRKEILDKARASLR